MNFGSLMQAPGPLSSARFYRTGYLPTCAAAVFLLVLVWAGAPGKVVSFSKAWHTAATLGIGEVLVLALAVTLAAVVLQPLQLSIVRVLEGGFPDWLGSGLARQFQLSRKRHLEKAVRDAIDLAVAIPDDTANRDRRDGYVQQAGVTSARLRSRFPMPEHFVRPTALGNALAAMEETAGAAYGLDAVVIWPRLYPLLADQVRGIVDDLRDSMDAAARLAATGALTAVAAVALLAPHAGWWTILALLPLLIAALAYLGAVQAAVGYGVAMQAAFDLHRFDMLRVLHLGGPANQDAEQECNRALSDFIRQGVPVPFSYTDPA